MKRIFLVLISCLFSMILMGQAADARFLQTDPIGYEDNYNLYAYVANDPITFTDPFGFLKCASGGTGNAEQTNLSTEVCAGVLEAAEGGEALVNNALASVKILKAFKNGEIEGSDQISQIEEVFTNVFGDSEISTIEQVETGLTKASEVLNEDSDFVVSDISQLDTSPTLGARAFVRTQNFRGVEIQQGIGLGNRFLNQMKEGDFFANVVTLIHEGAHFHRPNTADSSPSFAKAAGFAKNNAASIACFATGVCK